MATMLGELRPQANDSERNVYKTLQQNVSKEFYVYPETLIGKTTGEPERRPDFIIIHPDIGVLVLEVKGWRRFEARGGKVFVQHRDGSTTEEPDPSLQAEGYVDRIRDDIKAHDALIDPQRPDKLVIPVEYTLAFPQVTSPDIYKFEAIWGKGRVLAARDLAAGSIEAKLRAVPRHFKPLALSEYQFNELRSAISPISLAVGQGDSSQGILNIEQELLTVEPVRTRPTVDQGEQQLGLFLQDQLPEKARQTAGDLSVRLVRGVAGSGKSLVLARRAEYLQATHPDWNLLVLAFNRNLVNDLRGKLSGLAAIKVSTFHQLCRDLIEPHCGWPSLSNVETWVRSRFADWPNARAFDPDYVAEEVRWRKDLGLFDSAEYMNVQRLGRREGVDKNQRRVLDEIFQSYLAWQNSEHGQWDWEDVPHTVLRLIDEGSVALAQYDAILIDEAQDFAPTWIQVVKRLLKPDGLIFLADDPAQSIYRYFSWREKGVEVVGRTRWLRIPYRNTRQIHQAAYALIKDDKDLQGEAQSMGVPNLKPDFQTHELREGPRPSRIRFQTKQQEFDFISLEVDKLGQEGVKSIAVLHPRKHGVADLRRSLPPNVFVDTYQSIKGLEFEAVLLSQVQEAFGMVEARGSYNERAAKLKLLLYTGMTRAREKLYLLYEQEWPKELNAITPHVISRTI